MRIAVIGRGSIGSTLGGKWATAGHDVVYGVRTPGDADTAPVEEAVDGAEVVVLALPGGAAKELVARLGARLDAKTVVDATNDVGGAGSLNALGGLPPGAQPVRAFNTLGWENFADPVVAGARADLFFAAEDGPARELAEKLIREVGLEPVWVGGADAFEVVDGLTRLWFALAFRRGLGRRLAFKLLVEAPPTGA